MKLINLFPDKYIDSTYNIDFRGLYEKGYRGIIFDIDNTLVTHGAPHTPDSLRLINELKTIGYNILFLSNNKEPRVKSFNDMVDCNYIFKGGKPKRKGYLNAMQIMGTDKDNTLFVGDQIFTDIWGAKRTGIYSILVKPIDKHEEIQIVIKRRLEWIVLGFYKIYCKNRGQEFLESKR